MKKLLLITLLSMSAFGIHAQVCNPYSPTVAGAKAYVLPDSATGIQHACVGKPYEQIMNIKVFKDTLIGGLFTAVVDSMVINLDPVAIGLPAGFTLSSVPASLPANTFNNYPHMTLKGDSVGCVKITGTGAATSGVLPLTINLRVKAKINLGFITIDTVVDYANTNYSLTTDAIGTAQCFAAGLEELYSNILEILSSPNPANDKLLITVNAATSEKVILEISNMYGQILSTQQGSIKAGYNTFAFDVLQFPSGMYTYTIKNGSSKITKRWLKQ